MGQIFLYIGFMRFMDKQEHWGIIISLIAVFSVFTINYIYVHKDDNLRVIVFYFVMAVMAFLIVRSLLVYKHRLITASANFLSIIFLAHGCYFTFRAVLALTAFPFENVFSLTLMQVVTYLEIFITSYLWSYGLIIMINQRSNSEHREDKENLELIFNTSPDAVLITRLTDGAFVRINEGFTKLTGYTIADVAGKSSMDINLWYIPAERQKLVAALIESGFHDNLEVIFQRKDGSILTGMMSAKVIVLSEVPHIISVTHDITESKRMQVALRENEEKFRLLVENSHDIIYSLTADGVFIFVSPAWTKLLGHAVTEVLGKPFQQFIHPDDVHDYMLFLKSVIVKGQRLSGVEYRLQHTNGTWYWHTSSAVPFKDASGQITGLYGITRDITKTRRLQEDLQQQATTDELTGLINRRHFLKLASAELKRAIRFKHIMAIALIDIDHFKSVNDRCGHTVGDQTLLTFSKICQRYVREIDIFARFGGDEFVLLLPETKREQAFQILERVRHALASQTLFVANHAISITISSGISSLTDGQESLDTLIDRADHALYLAKEMGRNRILTEQVSALR